MVHNDHVRAISFGTSFLCGGFHSVRDNTMDNSRPEILSSEALPIFLKLLLFSALPAAFSHGAEAIIAGSCHSGTRRVCAYKGMPLLIFNYFCLRTPNARLSFGTVQEGILLCTAASTCILGL